MLVFFSSQNSITALDTTTLEFVLPNYTVSDKTTEA
jgi:hypothetical protein